MMLLSDANATQAPTHSADGERPIATSIMPRSKEAQNRYNDHRARVRREKLDAQRAAKAARKAAREQPPVITEADLLAFQLTHFGDDTCPDNWFVDAQLALHYDPAQDVWEEEDDGLGYYDDGMKRTLTDEQIEMFRHSELEEIARAERLAREEQGLDDEHVVTGASQRAASPMSDVSSMDEDLVGFAESIRPPPPKKPPRPAAAATAAASRSEIPTLPVPAFASSKRSNSTSTKASDDTKALRQMKKQRKEEVPYEQRNKRKWEEHIATVDPVKGTWLYDSKTENRLRRELDDVKAESVELDY